MAERKFDLSKFKQPKATVFSGRPQGEDVRKILGLDTVDGGNDTGVFILPSDTTSFNPSFYLGLLFRSIEKLGIEGFERKYTFSIEATEPVLNRILISDLEDGKRSALNALDSRSGLTFFTRQ